MKTLIIIGIVAASMGTTYAGCFPFAVGNDCCNLFGQNCDGPCWNAGCKTECQKGKYPGQTVSCPTSDNKYYFCCKTGSSCKASCTVNAKDCCCDPNKKEVIEISGIKYDLDNISQDMDPTTARVKLLNFGTNAGPRESAAPTLSVQLTSSQSSTYSFTSTTKISASAKVKAGVPFVGEGAVTFGVEQTFGVTDTKVRTDTISMTINTGQDYILPYSRQVWEFNSDMMMVKIPFKAIATVLDDCGKKSTMEITGSTSVKGVAAIIQGQYHKVAGPAVPIECKSPFDTPVSEQNLVAWCGDGSSEKCEDHALCKRFSFTGTCCKPGSLEGCCATAAAQAPRCDKYSPSRAVCPSPGGNFDPCCGTTLKSTSSQVANVPDVTWQVQAIVPPLEVRVASTPAPKQAEPSENLSSEPVEIGSRLRR